VNVEGSTPVEETEFWKQMNRDRIGNLLAGARLKAGLTQVQLAKKLGIRRNMVSDYERGRRSLSPGMAARFSEVLRIKKSHLQCKAEQQAGH
jgi:transcriptional regulator with XRE-family HTH domain